jgi:hypothetical protein
MMPAGRSRSPFSTYVAWSSASKPHGGTDYIEADLYDPAVLVSRARAKLDFAQPVAIMLMGVMGHVGNPDEDDDGVARAIVDRLKEALPSGGYLVMYEGTNTDPAQDVALRQYNESGGSEGSPEPRSLGARLKQ